MSDDAEITEIERLIRLLGAHGRGEKETIDILEGANDAPKHIGKTGKPLMAAFRARITQALERLRAIGTAGVLPEETVLNRAELEGELLGMAQVILKWLEEPPPVLLLTYRPKPEQPAEPEARTAQPGEVLVTPAPARPAEETAPAVERALMDVGKPQPVFKPPPGPTPYSTVTPNPLRTERQRVIDSLKGRARLRNNAVYAEGTMGTYGGSQDRASQATIRASDRVGERVPNPVLNLIRKSDLKELFGENVQ